MANLTPKQHRVGLGFAELVAELAAKAPDPESKSDLYVAIRAIRQRYGWGREEKVREILRVMGLGASTVADIVRETRFREQEVAAIKAELVSTGKIRCEKFSNGAGRPAEMCFLIEDRDFFPPEK